MPRFIPLLVKRLSLSFPLFFLLSVCVGEDTTVVGAVVAVEVVFAGIDAVGCVVVTTGGAVVVFVGVDVEPVQALKASTTARSTISSTKVFFFTYTFPPFF